MEKYELVMLMSRLVKLSNKKDIQKAINAVCETQMVGNIVQSDEEIKSIWAQLIHKKFK